MRSCARSTCRVFVHVIYSLFTENSLLPFEIQPSLHLIFNPRRPFPAYCVTASSHQKAKSRSISLHYGQNITSKNSFFLSAKNIRHFDFCLRVAYYFLVFAGCNRTAGMQVAVQYTTNLYSIANVVMERNFIPLRNKKNSHMCLVVGLSRRRVFRENGIFDSTFIIQGSHYTTPSCGESECW